MEFCKKLSAVLVLGLGVAMMPGCGSDDPTAPTTEPVPMAEVTWRAERLNVIEDCDASAGAGDFYLSFSLSGFTSGEEVLLAERRKVLVQENKGQVVWADDIGIALKAEVSLKDGARLLLKMSLYENDSSGPQVSAGNGWYYTYSTASGSWESEEDEGSMTFGANTYETLQLEDYSGDACNAFLRGRFSMEPVVE